MPEWLVAKCLARLRTVFPANCESSWAVSMSGGAENAKSDRKLKIIGISMQCSSAVNHFVLLLLRYSSSYSAPLFGMSGSSIYLQNNVLFFLAVFSKTKWFSAILLGAMQWQLLKRRAVGKALKYQMMVTFHFISFIYFRNSFNAK